MSHHEKPLNKVVPTIVLEGVESGKEIDWDASQSKDDSVESVLFPDDQGTFQDAVGQYVENEWWSWESHVHEKGEVIEPVAVKTEVSLLRENVEVSVNETHESEETEGLVELEGVFVGEELLDNVLSGAAVWFLVFQINFNFEFVLKVLW